MCLEAMRGIWGNRYPSSRQPLVAERCLSCFHWAHKPLPLLSASTGLCPRGLAACPLCLLWLGEELTHPCPS